MTEWEFLKAAEKGDVEGVRRLLERGLDANTTDLVSEQSALHLTVWRENRSGDQLGVVQLLLRAGADVNARDSFLKTPLIYAISLDTALDYIEVIIRELLSYGADTGLRDYLGLTAYHYACDLDLPRLMTLMIESCESIPRFEPDTSKDRRNLLQLTAQCSAEAFLSVLKRSSLEDINLCSLNKNLDDLSSLPCCLIFNGDIRGLLALLDRPGVDPGVLTRPAVVTVCRAVYSPVAFSFMKGTESDFPFDVVKAYLDHGLPVDPEYEVSFGGETEPLTCLEVLADFHEIHTCNARDKECRCASMFLLLLENGARILSYSPSPDQVVSSRLIKFLCSNCSVFGLSYLFRHSGHCDPYSVLKNLISLVSRETRRSWPRKNTKTVVDFLVNLCSPVDINSLVTEFSGNRNPLVRNLLSFQTYSLPTLKCLCRNTIRNQCRVDCADDANKFFLYIDDLPLPLSLIRYLKFDDLIFSLETHPDHPSFAI